MVTQYYQVHNFQLKTPNHVILESILKKISRSTTFQFNPFSNFAISGSKTGIQSCCNKKMRKSRMPTLSQYLRVHDHSKNPVTQGDKTQKKR
ncbi:hypothetical protein LguiA_020960 [Lonicera macranthoides]